LSILLPHQHDSRLGKYAKEFKNLRCGDTWYSNCFTQLNKHSTVVFILTKGENTSSGKSRLQVTIEEKKIKTNPQQATPLMK
jgi:hypothetical protein